MREPNSVVPRPNAPSAPIMPPNGRQLQQLTPLERSFVEAYNRDPVGMQKRVNAWYEAMKKQGLPTDPFPDGPGGTNNGGPPVDNKPKDPSTSKPKDNPKPPPKSEPKPPKQAEAKPVKPEVKPPKEGFSMKSLWKKGWKDFKRNPFKYLAKAGRRRPW